MKAIVRDGYRWSDGALCLLEIDKPVVRDDDVLVRIRAASADTYDLELPAVLQRLARLAARRRQPGRRVPGLDFAGQVEAVGKDVEGFQPGDEVFGWSKGAFAEYASVSANSLVLKPANLTFEQAAVVPMSGLTALQGLCDRGEVQPGQSVLILGASGGVGAFAVQIARAFGAKVTGVCSTVNVDLVRSLGADRVIDYTNEDFTEGGTRYDLILDMVGDRSLSDLRRVLNPNGTLVMVGSAGLRQSSYLWAKGIARWLWASVLSLVGDQRLRALMQSRNKEDLVVLKELIEGGKVTPVISAYYALSEAPVAMRHFQAGHGRGRVVITV